MMKGGAGETVNLIPHLFITLNLLPNIPMIAVTQITESLITNQDNRTPLALVAATPIDAFADLRGKGQQVVYRTIQNVGADLVYVLIGDTVTLGKYHQILGQYVGMPITTLERVSVMSPSNGSICCIEQLRGGNV